MVSSSSPAIKPVPICLVVGFLGSGKTTLLRHIARTSDHLRLAFVVNEFSTLDVDGVVIQQEHDKVVCLAGGSVFCKCLSGQFIQTLKDLPEALKIPLCDGVIVEASGIADPGVAQQMLFETGLDTLYRLSRVVAVVDPGNIARLLNELPNSKMQLLASDIVILNKADVYPEALMVEAEQEVRRVNDSAPILRASHCRVSLRLFEGVSMASVSGKYAACADPNFSNATAHSDACLDLDRLMRALQASRDFLYRAKGFLHDHTGPMYLDWTPSTHSRFELPGYGGPFAFTLIGNGTRAAAVNALAARIESGAFNR